MGVSRYVNLGEPKGKKKKKKRQASNQRVSDSSLCFEPTLC